MMKEIDIKQEDLGMFYDPYPAGHLWLVQINGEKIGTTLSMCDCDLLKSIYIKGYEEGLKNHNQIITKKCERCEKVIDEGFYWCPYCGNDCKYDWVSKY